MAPSAPAADFDENFNSIFSLQELIKKPLISIPNQYVHLDQENITTNYVNRINIPSIDFKQLVSEKTMDLELQKLHSSCKEWGIFQLVNHGVSSSLLEELKHEIEEFYKLPFEEKMRYKIKENEVEGYGTMARFGGKDLDWGDRFYMITNPIHTRKPHLLPELPSSLRNNLEDYLQEMQKLAMSLLRQTTKIPNSIWLFGHFRNNLEDYLQEMQKLAMSLLRLIARALDMELKDMEETFDDGMQSTRMTYYPPCPQPELAIGLTPHSDGSGITILNQVNGVDGLQIKKDVVWFPVTISPNSFVVNVGDILEIMSNGVYKSIEHRAVVNSEVERVSLAFFVNPRFEADVGPAKSIISSQNPPFFQTKTMETCFNDFFSTKLKGKSFLERMKK